MHARAPAMPLMMALCGHCCDGRQVRGAIERVRVPAMKAAAVLRDAELMILVC